MARTHQFFHILTCKWASRHSGVPFCAMGTWKMAPKRRWIAHFDLLLCFRPQRRASFRHQSFKKRSGAEVFCALPMCFAPQRRGIFAAPNFENGSEAEVSMYILTRKCASHHRCVPFFILLLNSYLRTRRFSEAIFRTAGTTHHWKNTAMSDFIWRVRILRSPDSTRMVIFRQVTVLACWVSV